MNIQCCSVQLEEAGELTKPKNNNKVDFLSVGKVMIYI